MNYLSVVGWLVIFHVISRDRGIKSVLWDAHAVHQIWYPGSDILDKGMSCRGNTVDGCLTQNTLTNVEWKVSIDAFSSEQSKDLCHDLMGISVLDFVENWNAVLHRVSFSVNLSQLLHDIRRLSHQDLVRGLSSLLHVLVVLNQFVEKNCLPESQKIR